MTVHNDVSTPPRTHLLDVYALISIVAGLVGAGGMVGFGTPILAVFAVGAGHVALSRSREGRSRLLAMIGLVLGYGVAIWGLARVVGVDVPALVSQR